MPRTSTTFTFAASNALALLTVMLVAACGGGGSGPEPTSGISPALTASPTNSTQERLAGTIAFTSYFNPHDLFAVKPDGSGLQRLTQGRENPAFDGGPLAIGGRPDQIGISHVWTVHPDGSGVNMLTDTEGDSCPAWSPDGHRIAFYSGRGGQLFLMNADGTGQAKVTAATTGTSVGSCPMWWSADGTSLAVYSSESGVVSAITTEGSNLREVIALPAGVQVAPSPDGSHWAFVLDNGIWIMAPGREPIQIPGVQADSRSIAWGP